MILKNELPEIEELRSRRRRRGIRRPETEELRKRRRRR